MGGTGDEKEERARERERERERGGDQLIWVVVHLAIQKEKDRGGGGV